MSEPWCDSLRRKLGWWRRELRFRWKFRHEPEVVATINPRPAPPATVARLRRRVLTGDWSGARYELRVLIGPCSEAEAETLMERIADIPEPRGPTTEELRARVLAHDAVPIASPFPGFALPSSHPLAGREAWRCNTCAGIFYLERAPTVCPYCDDDAPPLDERRAEHR